MTRKWTFFIHDILDAIQHIRSFMGDMTLEEFLADEKTRSAVAFKVENIGEAAKNIPREVRSRYRSLPWLDMAKMRDKITHSYFGINYKTVWKVAKEDLAVIEPLITQILSDLNTAEESKER
jgi:uncharacterized protein with HEPN domain